MQVDYIFVYGTLKQNIKKSKYNLISNFTKFVDYGYTYGTLYQIFFFAYLIEFTFAYFKNLGIIII